MTPNPLITANEAALLVGVSARTVCRWVAAGLLVAEPDVMRGRAKLYRVRAVFEAERASRTYCVDESADRVS